MIYFQNDAQKQSSKNKPKGMAAFLSNGNKKTNAYKSDEVNQLSKKEHLDIKKLDDLTESNKEKCNESNKSPEGVETLKEKSSTVDIEGKTGDKSNKSKASSFFPFISFLSKTLFLNLYILISISKYLILY